MQTTLLPPQDACVRTSWLDRILGGTAARWSGVFQRDDSSGDYADPVFTPVGSPPTTSAKSQLMGLLYHLFDPIEEPSTEILEPYRGGQARPPLKGVAP